MKYKLMGVSLMMVMLVCVGFAASAEKDSETGRYHQHLSAGMPREACDCVGGVRTVYASSHYSH